MSAIQINDLNSNASSLFDDPESYLNELSDESLMLSDIQGGATPALSCVVSIATLVTFATAGAAVGYAISQAFRKNS
jgi:hypothetical protein